MSNLQKEFNKIVTDIEKNLKNKEDVEYVKNQICKIYNYFITEIEELETKNEEKFEALLIRYKTIEDRMSDMEESIEKIENDIYIKENEEYDFNITCPYCKTEFEVDCSNGIGKSIECPECNNIIEIDWDEHDECSGDCCDCKGGCNHEHENDEDDM